MEKKRDRYAAGRSAETDGAKKLRKSYDMGLTTHSLSAPFTSRPIPNNHTISLPNMGSLSIYGQSVCQRSNIPHIWAQNEPDPYICVRGLTVPIYGHCQNMYSEYLLLMPLYGHMHAVYIFSFYDISIYGHITRLYGVLSKPQPNLTWHCIVCLSPGYIGIQTDRHKPISAYMGIKGIQADRWLIKVL